MTSDSGAVADSQTVPRRIDAARRTEVPRSHRLIRTVGIFLTTIAVLVSIGSFWIMTGASSIEPTPEIWTIIWIVNAVLVLFVVALIVTEALLLFRAWRRKLVGARLRSRLVILFALVAAVPGLIVAAFAAFTLNQGLDQWFSDRTRQIVESSRLIARAYLQEHGQVLRDDVIWVATELEAAHDTFVSDRTRFQHILTALATTRSLPYTSLVAGDGDLLMRAEINVQGRRPTAPASLLPDVQEGVPTLLSPGSTNLVGAMIKLRGYDNVYLFAARTVDPEVLEYVKLTEENITDYRTYESNRLVFQLTFGLMYTGLAVILVLAAVWLGMAMASRFVDPIRNLMVASNRVSRGQLDTRVPAEESVGDLHDLSIRFNQMVGQLESQRQALIDANENAEKRRQFTEAVVEGVSAGVVGLDSDGTITLANKRAGEMFHREEVDLMDRPVTEAAPQLEPLMARARSSRTGQLRDQIELSHNGEVRTYQVQLTREGTLTESKGYVITLDDITNLVTAQRTSAWADVARRIAHEIKNPLTPIQLSAERLRKRYASRLEGDLEVFDKCVNTIIRQVGDIGSMVDEFSSFAQMPSASLDRGDLADIIRQSVFTEGVRQPKIDVSTDVPDGPLWAEFDSRLIFQALTNLIKNAVEALEGAGLDGIDQPFVKVAVEDAGDFVRINVIDNGKGWPAENRQRLLEPYMTTREKGTGLGLAIVAKIVEQHGGTVELRDAPADEKGRVGACFSFTLKRLPAETETPVKPEAASDPETKPQAASAETPEEPARSEVAE